MNRSIPIHVIRDYFLFTSIVFALASSRFGILSLSTPLPNSAVIFEASSVSPPLSRYSYYLASHFFL